MEHIFRWVVEETMTSKYTQRVQLTGAGSKKTADVVCRRATTVDVNTENCQFVNALNVRTRWCRSGCSAFPRSLRIRKTISCDLAQCNWRLLLAAHDLTSMTSSSRVWEFVAGMMRYRRQTWWCDWHIGVASYGALGHVPPSTYNNLLFSVHFELYKVWLLRLYICRQLPPVKTH